MEALLIFFGIDNFWREARIVILRRISEFSLDRFEVILVHFERALYFFVTCVVHLINDGSDKLKKKQSVPWWCFWNLGSWRSERSPKRCRWSEDCDFSERVELGLNFAWATRVLRHWHTWTLERSDKYEERDLPRRWLALATSPD